MSTQNPIIRRYAPDLQTLSSLYYVYLWGLPRTTMSDCLDPPFRRANRDGQTSFLAATVITYGSFSIQFIAGIACLHVLWKSRRTSRSKTITWLILHTCALESMNMVGVMTDTLALQWYSGPVRELTDRICFRVGFETTITPHIGSAALYDLLDRLRSWLHSFGVLLMVSLPAFAINSLLTDIILIWKYTLFPKPNLIIIFPTFLLIASMVPLVYICVTQSFQWVPSEIVILNPLPLPSIMYFSLTLLLHVTLTGLIILRLWKCKRELRAVLGDGHGKHYNAIFAVFAGSAFMNVGCSTLLLASSLSEPSQTSAMNLNSTFQIWMAITPAVQACANYLIVYRGARGFYGSWSNNVSIPKVSTDVFASSEALANEYDRPDHAIRSRRTCDLESSIA